MYPLSPQQTRALRQQLKDAPPLEPKVSTFLSAYFYFEALLHTIGRYYRARHGSPKKTVGFERLNHDVVARSMKHFGIRVSPQTLNTLLSSDLRARGRKSARNLRNGVVHDWFKGDRAEICERFERLNGALISSTSAIQKGIEHT